MGLSEISTNLCKGWDCWKTQQNNLYLRLLLPSFQSCAAHASNVHDVTARGTAGNPGALTGLERRVQANFIAVLACAGGLGRY